MTLCVVYCALCLYLCFESQYFFSRALLTLVGRARVVYLLSVALRSQDVKLNDVSWDHYLINEPPPLKCAREHKNKPLPSPWEPTHLLPCSLSLSFSLPFPPFVRLFFAFSFPFALDSFVKSALAMHMVYQSSSLSPKDGRQKTGPLFYTLSRTCIYAHRQSSHVCIK